MLSHSILLGSYNNSGDQGEGTSCGNAKHELFAVIVLFPVVTEYTYGSRLLIFSPCYLMVKHTSDSTFNNAS